MAHATESPQSPLSQPYATHRSSSWLEQATIVHVAMLAIGCAWAFGGNAYWSRMTVGAWASLGLILTVAALRDPRTRREGRLVALRWLWPFALLNVLVVAGCFNPGFRAVADGADVYYVQGQPDPRFPSNARPELSLQSLWFFDAVYLSCFNLLLIVRQRAAIRWLLLAVVGNAVLLAVFGTVQKLLGATAPFLGAKKSTQPFFFSSFLYHNHWGAHTLLMLSACVALVLHFARDGRARDFWHSPGFGGLIAVALLAMSVPLSGSRSSTVLVVLLLTLALLQACLRFSRAGLHGRKLLAPALTVAAALLIITGALGYHLARPVITSRLHATYQQVGELRARQAGSTRMRLYHDTWQMARERPWFGWGLASYPTVFYLFNSQRYPHPDKLNLQVHFRDAHSDWLQSVAEVGFVGTAFFVLCAVVPLYHCRRGLAQSWFSSSLLLGLGVLLLYAAVEFPFRNGAVIVAFWLCFFCAARYPGADALACHRR